MLKHFAANERETHRSVSGLVTWLSEQALREVYLKGFEIAIKTARNNVTLKADGSTAEGCEVKAMGVMSSFNRIGTRWTGGDYRLLTQILRNEWGFRGIVITDFNTVKYMVLKDMAYAGGNLNLQVAGLNVWNANKKNAADVAVLKQAAKEILYTVANSNAYTENFTVTMPVWQILLIVFDCLFVVGFGVWGFFAIRKAVKKIKRQNAATIDADGQNE